MIIAIVMLAIAVTVTTMMVVAEKNQYKRIEKCGKVELYREAGAYWVKVHELEQPFKTYEEALSYYKSMIRVYYLPELYYGR